MDKGTESGSVDKPEASKNKPKTERVLCSSVATLTPRAWINNEVVNYVGRVLIASDQRMNQTKVHICLTFSMSRLQN